MAVKIYVFNEDGLFSGVWLGECLDTFDKKYKNYHGFLSLWKAYKFFHENDYLNKYNEKEWNNLLQKFKIKKRCVVHYPTNHYDLVHIQIWDSWRFIAPPIEGWDKNLLGRIFIK